MSHQLQKSPLLPHSSACLSRAFHHAEWPQKQPREARDTSGRKVLLLHRLGKYSVLLQSGLGLNPSGVYCDSWVVNCYQQPTPFFQGPVLVLRLCVGPI